MSATEIIDSKEIKECKKYIPKKNRHWIQMPLKIPQNIIDTLQEYWNWRDDQSKYPAGEKDRILNKLSKVCLKWHLYSGYEACAGTFIFYTKVGVYINASYERNQNPPYFQMTRKAEDIFKPEPSPPEKIKNGHYYKYIWNNKK